MLALSCCNYIEEKRSDRDSGKYKLIDNKGSTIQTRFNPPDGYFRKPAHNNSFTYYLRNLPLKPAGSVVKYFNGKVKENDVYEAVVDMEISDKDLQQCADAVMRLRGEYLYSIHAYGQITFTLTNGFRMDYKEWMSGMRVKVTGNKTSWYKAGPPSNSHKDLRKYLDFVFMYAGTISLSKSLHSKNLQDIEPGDVFIYGGSPGHAVIVVDVAENKEGRKVFMLAQSYMPAQEIQILKNMNDSGINPWYKNDINGKLYTPEWTFETNQLKTW